MIHAFAVPSFGIKIDAIPGRLNKTWFKAERVGIYYGQCSELCGRDHDHMPIAVHVVSEKDYQAWLDQAKKKFAADDSAARPAQAAPSRPTARRSRWQRPAPPSEPRDTHIKN